MDKLKGNVFERIEELKTFIDRYLAEMENIQFDRYNELGIKRIENMGKWYLECLKNKKVVGVDGSQINPLRELGIPIGVIQVAKVKVWHGAGKSEIEHYTMPITIDDNVNLRRFELEIDALIDEVQKGGWLFFDGSFTAPEIKDSSKLHRLFNLSERYSTPVIGYIDKSFSRDLAEVFELNTYDTFLLKDLKVLEYTKPFVKENLAYAYVKFNPALPARLEYPSWMISMHDDVVRIVAAQCQLSVTKGYPYVLERAHKFSIIDRRDRAKFMRTIKSYSISFKWLAKMR